MIQWIMLIAIGIILLSAGIFAIVKICKMSEEERRNLIIQWLIGAVTIAENAIKEQGAGVQKLEMVISEFNKKAPILCKILLYITKCESLTEMIEKALEMAKSTWNENN